MPQGQHYVPRIYLQRFAYSENGDLWGLRVKRNYPGRNPNPKQYNKSEICKLTDFYNFNDIANLHEKKALEVNYIEQYGFPYENNELKRVFDALESRQAFFHSNAYRLLVILFNLKRRNPTYLNLILNHPIESLDRFVDQEVGKLKQDFADAELENLPVDFEGVKEDQKSKLRNDGHRSDMHKNMLIDTQQVNDEGERERISKFLSFHFTLYSTTVAMPFVTSDNPGFTLAKENQVFNLEIGHTHTMVFPISCLSALVINFKVDPEYSNRLIYKNIHRKNAEPSAVDIINQGTACSCMEYIYGLTPDSLIIAHESWLRTNS